MPHTDSPPDDWTRTKQVTLYVLAAGLPGAAFIGGMHGAAIYAAGADPIVLLAVLTIYGCLPMSLLLAIGVSLYAITQRKHLDILLFLLSMAYFVIFPWSVIAGRQSAF